MCGVWSLRAWGVAFRHLGTGLGLLVYVLQVPEVAYVSFGSQSLQVEEVTTSSLEGIPILFWGEEAL